MQKKSQKQTKPIKQILLFMAIVIIVLLLIFAEEIIKLTNKNQINISENTEITENVMITNEPNIPELSAGMIPVKYENGKWRIIAEEDEDTNWYNYEKGQPAYVMLNNGTYQSELIPDMTNKELAEENIGKEIPDNSNARGSIYMWIPRFAYNDNGEIGYIKEETQPGGEWIVPEIFSYTVADETIPDFSLSGVWVEKDVNTACVGTITEMQNEKGIYGFIADTKPKQITSTDIATMKNYIANVVGNDAPVVPQINDITNQNRIILQIVNTNKLEPIKAKCGYSKTTGLINVEVTYSRYGINKILYKGTQELKVTQNGNKATATSEGLKIEEGIAKITIIDNKGNKKELKISMSTKVYVKLYENGTLAFTSDNEETLGEVSKDYGDISGKNYTDEDRPPWDSETDKIETVEFVNEISPTSTSMWFSACTKLNKINKIQNLNTSNVTNMYSMFEICRGLTELDLSNFDTSNVTNMEFMFRECENITTLDLSNFDTSKVTSMYRMFDRCKRLTELNLSNFNTRKVREMNFMFRNCSKLQAIYVGENWVTTQADTTDMFTNCGVSSVTKRT